MTFIFNENSNHKVFKTGCSYEKKNIVINNLADEGSNRLDHDVLYTNLWYLTLLCKSCSQFARKK